MTVVYYAFRMKKPVYIILLCLLSGVLSVTLSGCHSSKKTVKGSSGVPVRTVDYGEMRSDIISRNYDIPVIAALVEEAARWIGVPYRYAGNDKGGVDCSGLTSQVFLKTLNVKLPRNSAEQQRWCKGISKENLQPGDLVFFATGSNRDRVSHVGIYVGNGDIIHASSSRGVIVSNLGEKYYTARYHSSGRPEVIHNLYASASKKDKNKGAKNNGSDSKNDQPVDLRDIPGTAAGKPVPTDVPSISVDELIEMQVDSIARTLPQAPSVQPPSVQPHEPTDTIITQFFD